MDEHFATWLIPEWPLKARDNVHCPATSHMRTMSNGPMRGPLVSRAVSTREMNFYDAWIMKVSLFADLLCIRSQVSDINAACSVNLPNFPQAKWIKVLVRILGNLAESIGRLIVFWHRKGVRYSQLLPDRDRLRILCFSSFQKMSFTLRIVFFRTIRYWFPRTALCVQIYPNLSL
jgi:hypothetical protein